MNLLEELHQKFKNLPNVTSALVKRYTKLHWDDCDEIADELNEIRLQEGIKPTPILHEKRTRKSKYRRMTRI